MVRQNALFSAAFPNVVHRLLQLRVETVNPKLAEVAEHDERRAMRHQIELVIKRLLVVFGEFLAARFHFDQHAARPDKIGKLGMVAGKADAMLEGEFPGSVFGS